MISEKFGIEEYVEEYFRKKEHKRSRLSYKSAA